MWGFVGRRSDIGSDEGWQQKRQKWRKVHEATSMSKDISESSRVPMCQLVKKASRSD